MTKSNIFVYAFCTGKTHDFLLCLYHIFAWNHLLSSSSATPGLFAHVTLDVIRRWGRRDTRKSWRMAAATNFKILHLIYLFWFHANILSLPFCLNLYVFVSSIKIPNIMVMSLIVVSSFFTRLFHQPTEILYIYIYIYIYI